MRRECRERFTCPRVSIPDMHHGTRVTYVHAVMHAGSLTSAFLWSRWWGKRSRHSGRMCTQQFCVPGKRPMSWFVTDCWGEARQLRINNHIVHSALCMYSLLKLTQYMQLRYIPLGHLRLLLLTWFDCWVWDNLISHPCPNFSGALNTLLLSLGHGSMIIILELFCADVIIHLIPKLQTMSSSVVVTSTRSITYTLYKRIHQCRIFSGEGVVVNPGIEDNEQLLF